MLVPLLKAACKAIRMRAENKILECCPFVSFHVLICERPSCRHFESPIVDYLCMYFTYFYHVDLLVMHCRLCKRGVAFPGFFIARQTLLARFALAIFVSGVYRIMTKTSHCASSPDRKCIGTKQ